MPRTRESSWGAADVTRHFETRGWTDPGEAAAMAAAGDLARGRVLDLGVGGGRTTGLLAPGAAAYVGIDLEPAMITLARRSFPGADLRVGDARDVSVLPDLPAGDFDLVLWSFNGIDVLPHGQRVGALAAMAAMIAPHGRVLFSSLNLDGVSYDERPWWLAHPAGRRSRGHALLLARHPSMLARGVRNYLHTRRQSQDGDGWGMRPMRAHEFRFVVHFATLAETVAEARAAGLVVEAAWSDAGLPIDASAPTTDADYVHYLCRLA